MLYMIESIGVKFMVGSIYTYIHKLKPIFFVTEIQVITSVSKIENILNIIRTIVIYNLYLN